MAKRGYNGRISCLVSDLSKRHEHYILLGVGDEYHTYCKCLTDRCLDQWLEEAREEDTYKMWWDYDYIQLDN